MTQLNHLMDAPFKCGPKDVDVAAFVEATPIIEGRDAMEEFLTCGIWALSDG
jgi:hypothetical protein